VQGYLEYENPPLPSSTTVGLWVTLRMDKFILQNVSLFSFYSLIKSSTCWYHAKPNQTPPPPHQGEHDFGAFTLAGRRGEYAAEPSGTNRHIYVCEAQQVSNANT